VTGFSVAQIGSIQPSLGIAAAALEDKSLLISHLAELIFGNLLNPDIVI